jgi:hypothetical protein
MKWLPAAFAIAALAQQPPRLASGKIELHAAAGSSLAQQIRGVAGPAWVGYTVTAVPGHRGCCMSINNGICSYGCALEGGSMNGVSCPASEGNPTVFLEGERTVNILYRVDKGEIERVRAFSPSCQLDIGGLTLRWLSGVQPAESVAFLKTLTLKTSSVLSAIAAHADPSADAYLKEVAESTTAVRRDRERAAYSLASTRGAAGIAVVMRLLESDQDEQFRSTLPGAIAQAPSGAGISTLIDLATKDKSRKVRERAFFWLGRSTDTRAQKFVEEVLSK